MTDLAKNEIVSVLITLGEVASLGDEKAAFRHVKKSVVAKTPFYRTP